MVGKQQAGFKFGKHRLKLRHIYGEVQHNGRTYRLCRVETEDHLIYDSLRLYNSAGKFIKQLLTEPEIASSIAELYKSAERVKQQK